MEREVRVGEHVERGEETHMESRESEVLRLPELRERLKADGFKITKRTFEYYQRLGLLPRPEKRVGERGRGVYGYYDAKVIDMVKMIFRLKAEGKPLAAIREEAKRTIVERYKALLSEWGFTGYLPGRGGAASSVRGEAGEGAGGGPYSVDSAALREEEAWNPLFEDKIFEELEWWSSDAAIKRHAAEHVARAALCGASGVRLAINEAIAAWRNGSEEKGRSACSALIRRLVTRAVTLDTQRYTACAALAEFSGGEYLRKGEEEWLEAAAESDKRLAHLDGMCDNLLQGSEAG